MKLTAQLDVDVVALQQQDDLTCLISFDAPKPPDTTERPGEALVFVVDRSGSMNGDRLDAVRASLHAVVDRMRPMDSFGVVTFDHTAQVAVPLRPVRDHDLNTVHNLISHISAGGSTDLSAGYLLGLTEARRVTGATGSALLLLSDGHANAGIRDAGQLGALAAQAATQGITTGTIGMGSGYDESLLAELATHGRGAHRFAATSDDATAVVAEESGDLLSKVIVNAFLRIRPESGDLISGIHLLNELPCWTDTDPDGASVIVVPLGDFYAGEHRELLARFTIPEVESLGALPLVTFTIEYVALPSVTAESISWPVTVNVAAADDARRRTSNPTVTTARLLFEATQAKKAAAARLDAGDTESAAALMDAQATLLHQASLAIIDTTPDAQRIKERLVEEREQAEKLARAARQQEASLSKKSFAEEIQREMMGRNDEDRRRRARQKREY